MSDDDMIDMPVSAFPNALMNKFVVAAGFDTCRIDSDDDGVDDLDVSSYAFLEDLSKNPDKYATVWKAAVATLGVAAAGQWGFFVGSAVLGPLAPFAWLGSIIAAPFFGSNRSATIVLSNQTDGAMRQKEIYQDCGFQTGRPVFSEKDAATQSVIATHPGMIPGRAKLGGTDMLTGLGIYRFEKNKSVGIGFYGTAGAISFSFDDPLVTNDMAIAWIVPQHGDPYYACTNNLSHYTSLQDFYEKTVDVRESGAGELPGYAYSTKCMKSGALKFLQAMGIPTKNAPAGPAILMSQKEREFPSDPDDDDMVFTVACFNEKPGDAFFEPLPVGA